MSYSFVIRVWLKPEPITEYLLLGSWTYRKWSTREKTVFFWVSNSSERLKPSKEVKREKKKKKNNNDNRKEKTYQSQWR